MIINHARMIAPFDKSLKRSFTARRVAAQLSRTVSARETLADESRKHRSTDPSEIAQTEFGEPRSVSDDKKIKRERER